MFSALWKVVKFVPSLIGKALGETKALSEDVARVLSHPSKIGEGLKLLYTKNSVSKEAVEAFSGMSSNIEAAGEALSKASKPLQLQVAQKFLGKHGNKIEQQMQQLNLSHTGFEKTVEAAKGVTERLSKRISEINNDLSVVGKDADNAFKLRSELFEVTSKRDELQAAAVVAAEKGEYVGRLKEVVKTFEAKLRTEGFSDALTYMESAEKSVLKPTSNAMLEELAKVQTFINGLKADLPKEVPAAMSEMMKSGNLDSARALLKEYAYLRATKSEALVEAWKNNPDNLKMLNKIENSVFGTRFHDLLNEIKATKTPRKFAGSFAGKSPQEIAQSIGVPGAAGVVASSLGAFGLFNWFFDNDVAFLSLETKNLLGKLDKLQVSAGAIRIVESTKQMLVVVQKSGQSMHDDFGNNPHKAINEDLQSLLQASAVLVSDFGRWNLVVANSTDKALATEIGNDLGLFLTKTGEEVNKLLVSMKQNIKATK